MCRHRSPFLLLLALAALVTTPHAVSAQQHAPLDIDAERLRLGGQTLAISAIRGTDTIPIGMIEDELTLLTEGWSIEVPAFLPASQSVETLTGRVVGVESIDGEPCWRVDTDFAGMAVTFWIHRESRDLVQQVLRLDAENQFLFRRPAGSNPPPVRPTV